MEHLTLLNTNFSRTKDEALAEAYSNNQIQENSFFFADRVTYCYYKEAFSKKSIMGMVVQ